MPLHGIAVKPGTCAICKEVYAKGAHVYHDWHKKLENSVVHKLCWDDLKAARSARGEPLQKFEKGRPILSTVELDPPF